jgi:hypothetical protein
MRPGGGPNSLPHIPRGGPPSSRAHELPRLDRQLATAVHTAGELTSDSFTLTLAGRPAQLADVFPGFDDQDRVGVVVRKPCGAVGASALVLACVTAFYDVQRARSDEFFIYPDYFFFHLGERLGDHGMLDVWPDHKEVVVPDEPEQILRAINDRGITRLLVEDGDPGSPEFERQSLASAESRIVTALAYCADGRVARADVTAAGNDVTDSYVAAVLEHAGLPSDRCRFRDDGRFVESYRRITLAEALTLLAV